MNPPFTTEQFLQVFEQYNQSLFPLPLLIAALGLLVVVLVHTSLRNRDLVIGSVLGFLWIWTGIAYHLVHFSAINAAAPVFGVLFILQGLIFLYITFSRRRMEFSFRPTGMHYVGYLLALFGLAVYPWIGYPGEPAGIISLGLPCPTVIFTFGLLMVTRGKVSFFVLVIPFLWSIVGLSAVINFEIYQDLVMLAAAVTATIYLLARNRNRRIARREA